MNLGQLTSLTHCKKCGVPIEITPFQSEINCKVCGNTIDLTSNIFDDNINLSISKDRLNIIIELLKESIKHEECRIIEEKWGINDSKKCLKENENPINNGDIYSEDDILRLKEIIEESNEEIINIESKINKYEDVLQCIKNYIK